MDLYHFLQRKGHSGWQVFADFCEMAAMAIANAWEKCEVREEKYMRIVGRYSRPELDSLCEMLACVVEGLNREVEGQLRDGGGPALPRCDFLGSLFMELELSSHWRGQFFTPYPLCELMGRMTFSPDMLGEKGFVTVMEPASGAGAMIIGFANAMLEAGFNPQEQLHATAIDVDETAAYMTYIQLSLLGLPAIVHVGDALSGAMREVLRTPFHHLGLWDWKLRGSEAPGGESASPREEGDPTPVAVAPGAANPVVLTLDDPSAPSSAAAPRPAASSPSPRGLVRPAVRTADVTLPPAVQTDLFSAAA